MTAWIYRVSSGRRRLPVKAIRLDRSADTQPFLDQIFRRVAIRLVARSFRDDLIVVHDEQDTPEIAESSLGQP